MKVEKTVCEIERRNYASSTELHFDGFHFVESGTGNAFCQCRSIER
jgi:hypothetical protein